MPDKENSEELPSLDDISNKSNEFDPPDLSDLPDLPEEPVNKDGKTKSNKNTTKNNKKTNQNTLVKKIITVLCNKLSTLKQKKYWIPLVLGHVIMFSGTAYFIYWEETKKRSPEYVIEIINTALETNDAVLFTQVFNASSVIDNTYNSMREHYNVSSDLAEYVGEFPTSLEFNQHASALLLSIIKGDDSAMPFDKKLDLLPADLISQLRSDPVTLNQELSNPENNTYVIETTINTIKWGKYQLQMIAQLQNDALIITDIINIQKIIKIYDSVLANIRKQEENYVIKNKTHIKNMVHKYLPNITCSASITELSGKQILLIRINADANNMEKNIIAWSADVNINFEDGSLFMEKYLKINKLFYPQNIIANTWNITLTDEETKQALGKQLICTTNPILVNLPENEFYQITE